MGVMVVRMQTTTLNRTVAANVSRTIADTGTRLGWLSEKSGIAEQTLRRSLVGNRPFNLNELAALAEALRVPISTFFDGINREKGAA